MSDPDGDRAANTVLDEVKRVASIGYLRNRFSVVQNGDMPANGHSNGGSTAGAPAAAPLTEPVTALAGGPVEASGGNGTTTVETTEVTKVIAVSAEVASTVDVKLDRIREARMKGYEGEQCPECSAMTLLRNGSCLKCDTCGATTGCS